MLPPSPYHPQYQHRATLSGLRGAVASASPQAAAAGVRVLLDGGSAVDAAIAMAAVECVTLPGLCGLGGELFALVRHRGDTVAFCGSGRSPLAASAEDFRKAGLAGMPTDGPQSVAVPGEVDAWDAMHRRFGTMPWSDLVVQAVPYAERGFVVGRANARHLAIAGRAILLHNPGGADLLPGGGAPAEGSILPQPDLAGSLRTVAAGGRDAFYGGELAKAIVTRLNAGGSPYTVDEFLGHGTDVGQPLVARYRDVDVLQPPLPSQGVIVLEMLRLMDGFSPASGPLSPEWIHTMVEAKRLAYSDRMQHLGDPAFVSFDANALLAADHIAARRAQIQPDRAMDYAAPARGAGAEGSTTSFVVMDGNGMSVTLIHSLSTVGGSGVVAPGTGILLNNRSGRGFTLESGHPNGFAGGKRTMHTLNCYMLERNGELIALGGTPGGDGQPQWNAQVISGLVDFGFSAQQATEWPRWSHLPGTDPATLGQQWRLEMDGRFPAETMESLRGLGHPVAPLAEWQPGAPLAGVQLITVDPETGAMSTGSDPRAGGLGLAF